MKEKKLNQKPEEEGLPPGDDTGSNPPGSPPPKPPGPTK